MNDFLSYDWSRLEGLGFDLDFVQKSLPPTYKKGLTSEEQEIAKREAKETMAKAKEGKVSSKELYKDWESDKRYRNRTKKIPKSESTKAFERMFAEPTGVDKALANKAKKSGIPLRILRKVFERGMAAWRSGHRPGVAPQQWAFGRVNSFITGKGGARKADEDLWKKAKFSEAFEAKECGASAIPDWKRCKKEVVRHTAEHVAQGVAAWKTGKVLGSAISGALETHYGIPREVSSKLSESVVQAIASTALSAKHLKDVDDVLKKVSVEFLAAFIGKTAHQGTENFLSSQSVQQSLEHALPILSGKFAGIGTSFAGGKVPSAAQLGKMILQRSQADSARLFSIIQGAKVPSFSENFPSEAYLADMSVLLLLAAFVKNKGKTA